MLARPERGVSESSVKIGYARVSTEEQNLSLQRDALERAGAARGFEDHAGGAPKYRPGLEAALNMLTRTSSQQLAMDQIYMNSVDTGWVTN